MNNSTPYFPQLRAQCAPLGAQIKRAGAATDSIVGLAALFGGDFAGLLVPAKKGTGSRQRELPRVAVFWAFLGQVLMRGVSYPMGVDALSGRRGLPGPPASGQWHRSLLSGPPRPAAASPAPGNDDRKTTSFSPSRAGGCAYPILGDCDDRRFLSLSWRN